MPDPQSVTGDGKPGGGDPGTDKTFTQADLDKILAKERNIWERKHAAPTEEREELERLRQEREQREQREAEQRGEFEKSKKLLEDRHTKELGKRDESVKTLTSELRSERIRRALVSEAAKGRAVDPDLVADNLERHCQLNDKFQAEALGEDGGLLTIEELVTGFLSTKPYLVRPGSDGQGGGSKGGAVLSGGRAGSAELQTALKKLDEADKLAKASGMPHDLARVQEAHRQVKALQAAGK